MSRRPQVRWVAEPPYRPAQGGAWRGFRRAPGPYTGPPSYPATPRWGFPNLVWRQPTTVPGTPSERPRLVQRLQMLSRNTLGVLWTVAALALVACGAETWRYVLLVRSRDSAIDADILGASDALVLIAALLTFVAGLIAMIFTVWWLLTARGASEEESGAAPPRSVWQVLLGVLVPGLNLAMAGSIVAELEHAASGGDSAERPRPSRLVLAWWAAWIGNGILLAVTIAWRLGDGVQAQANAVVTNALLDLSAAVLAVLTGLLVRRLTRLLAPVRGTSVRRMRLAGVHGAPEPERRSRPAGTAR